MVTINIYTAGEKQQGTNSAVQVGSAPAPDAGLPGTNDGFTQNQTSAAPQPSEQINTFYSTDLSVAPSPQNNSGTEETGSDAMGPPSPMHGAFSAVQDMEPPAPALNPQDKSSDDSESPEPTGTPGEAGHSGENETPGPDTPGDESPGGGKGKRR
jgi:hypothetical protein